MAQRSTQQLEKKTTTTRSPGEAYGIRDADGVVERLNQVLADEFVLYTKTRNYHWNVTGGQFIGLHEFFEDQYKTLASNADQVAERATTLGGVALGTLAGMRETTRIDEDAPKSKPPTARTMIETLAADHARMAANLRQDAHLVLEEHGDDGTNDLLVGLLRQHEKTSWMLRAHLARND